MRAHLSVAGWDGRRERRREHFFPVTLGVAAEGELRRLLAETQPPVEGDL